MTERYRKALKISVAGAIALASLPLTRVAIDAYFGLGSLLIVPTFAVSAWMLITASGQWRPWWFGFVISIGVFLPLCPLIEGWLSGLAIYFQRLSQTGVLHLSQRVIEPTLILSVVICPLVLSSVLGCGLAWCVQRLSCARKEERNERWHQGLWRFSVCEMLIAFSGICLLAAWIGSQTRHWQSAQDTNKLAFLSRFNSSFWSGEVELMAEPIIEDLQRARMKEYGFATFRPRGVNEYRIVAPITTKGKTVWAVWAYTCNEEANDFVYQFGYAESPEKEQLPDFPFPAKRYIEGTWQLIDGMPATAGASATVTTVTSPAVAEQPIVLTASAPPGSVCELHLFPKSSLPALPPKTADQSGRVSWRWTVTPDMAGCNISYELKCIQKRGAAELANSTRGNVRIIAATGSSQ